MQKLTICAARIDGHKLSGNVYSFEPIYPLSSGGFRLGSARTRIVQVDDHYNLERVQPNPSPNGDGVEGELMLHDELETQRSDSGRVYLRAARVIERHDHGDFGRAV